MPKETGNKHTDNRLSVWKLSGPNLKNNNLKMPLLTQIKSVSVGDRPQNADLLSVKAKVCLVN